MGKKSKKRRRHRNYDRPAPAHNRHHICYQRKKWRKGLSLLIRSHWYMQIDLDVNTHAMIHREVGSIAVPSDEVSAKVYARLCEMEQIGAIKSDDSLKKRLKVIIYLFQGLDDKVADDFRKQLAVIQ